MPFHFFRSWVLLFTCLLLRPAMGAAAAPDKLCRARGGTVLTQRFGEYDCQAKLSEAECKLRNGVWFAYDATSSHWTCHMDMTPQAEIDACRAAEGLWGLHGSMTFYCLYPRDQQACLGKGGSWTQQGIRGIYGCVLPAADAGKTCHDGSECQFKRCVYPEGRAGWHLPGTRWSGQCAHNDSVYGCYRLVEKGELMDGICGD